MFISQNTCFFRNVIKREIGGKKFQRTISHNVLQVRSKTATVERSSPSKRKANFMESLVPRSRSDESRQSKLKTLDVVC